MKVKHKKKFTIPILSMKVEKGKWKTQMQNSKLLIRKVKANPLQIHKSEFKRKSFFVLLSPFMKSNKSIFTFSRENSLKKGWGEVEETFSPEKIR